jgi:hypothetical protein
MLLARAGDKGPQNDQTHDFESLLDAQDMDGWLSDDFMLEEPP